jgi:hypothetical protein
MARTINHLVAKLRITSVTNGSLDRVIKRCASLPAI